MTIPEKAAAWAESIARDDKHGYDQLDRWGPDYDCSSLVITAYKQAGLDLKSTYTGNMRADFLAHGFRDVTAEINLSTGAGLSRGDVLLNEGSHTVICTGGGMLVNASGNERGGVTGGTTGDQTLREIALRGYYNFPWDCVLRYKEEIPGRADEGKDSSSAAQNDRSTYIVKQGDSLWAIAERELGDGALYEELRRENGLAGYTIYPGQTLRLPRRDTASVTLTLPAATWESMERRAAERGKTVAALLEELFAAAS